MCKSFTINSYEGLASVDSARLTGNVGDARILELRDGVRSFGSRCSLRIRILRRMLSVDSEGVGAEVDSSEPVGISGLSETSDQQFKVESELRREESPHGAAPDAGRGYPHPGCFL